MGCFGIRRVLRSRLEERHILSPEEQSARAEAEVRRVREQIRVQEESRIREARRLEEEKRLEEERRLLEEQRLREERRLQEERRVEEERRLEEERHRMFRQQIASTESVRRLRDLVRQRYQQDIYIWSKRGVQRADRKLIQKECEKADRILGEIYFIVDAWEEDQFEKRDEWYLAKAIKDSLSHRDQHATWGDVPPWDRGANGEILRRP